MSEPNLIMIEKQNNPENHGNPEDLAQTMFEWKETDFGKIPIDWDLKKIIDIKSDDRRAIAMGPFGSNIKAENFVTKGVPVIRGTNFNFEKFIDGEFVFLSEEKADELIGSNCKPGDLVFTHRGTIGQVGLIPENKYSRYVISQSGMKLTVNPDLMDNEFLFYFFKSEYGQYQILKYESQVGVPSISNPLTSLKEIEVPVPPLPEQRAIASILSSLDDKIDLLHRQNATLEKMAETLFRQWFVEEAKEDWEEISLIDAIELVGGGTPKTSVNEYWNGNIKWLSGGDIASNHKNFVVSSEKSITELGLNNSSAKLLPKFSTVISARGTVGKYCMLSEPMAYSQSNYGILPKYKECFFFTYLLIAHSVDELQSAAYGSVFDTITTNTFKGITISRPEGVDIIRFNESMKPYFSKILTNQNQIRTLTALRYTLLPKLMNGEVRVEN